MIGGMALATVATLLVLPAVFTLFLKRASSQSPSLDPDDPASVHFDPVHIETRRTVARPAPAGGRTSPPAPVPISEHPADPEPRIIVRRYLPC